MQEREKDLSVEERDLLCAPEATDDLADIEFEEESAGAERGSTTQDFIQGWLEEELAYVANLQEGKQHV
jgi:hypothetical protein